MGGQVPPVGGRVPQGGAQQEGQSPQGGLQQGGRLPQDAQAGGLPQGGLRTDAQQEVPYGVVDEGVDPDGVVGDGGRGGRLVGVVGLVVGALVATGLSVSWIWDKADAVTPVSLPSANSTPFTTISPSARPTTPPPPEGKVLGSNIVAFNTDTMPVLSSEWTDNGENTGLLGGAATWLTVHEKYDGKKANWGNYVAFGGLHPKIKFVNTPAGLKQATRQAASVAIVRLYDEDVKFIGKATHTPITVDGHAGHELSIKVVVSEPKLKETFSTVTVAVIDRGDGTADVAIGDFAGSTPQWIPIWRAKVQEIQINR
ncbi:hypothetical protein [Kribbella catacumbae]|uniref:hypothetical protein n=1 Tax=Kribbella catacumbae TaxID=460086 RepID=UPI001ED99C15|nr:hypothetical protein [Kribbella catacumbae]